MTALSYLPIDLEPEFEEHRAMPGEIEMPLVHLPPGEWRTDTEHGELVVVVLEES